MAASLVLSASARRAFDRLAADLRRVLAQRFVALIASGPRTGVAFADPLLPGDLEAFAALVETWHQDGLETPLVLTPDEFTRSLDAFPLEYQTILDQHVVIAGHPPFAGVAVDRGHLRRACEVQAKSHLIHLRQGWIEAMGHDDELGAVIARSAQPLRALLSNVARLAGATGDHDDHAMRGATLAGLPLPIVADVLRLEQEPEQAEQLVARIHEYLAAALRLWTFVDEWR